MDDSPGQCRALTKQGQRCSIDADASGLCHVHNPDKQCGYIMRSGERRGKPCRIATGGGLCQYHEKFHAKLGTKKARQQMLLRAAARDKRVGKPVKARPGRKCRICSSWLKPGEPGHENQYGIAHWECWNGLKDATMAKGERQRILEGETFRSQAPSTYRRRGPGSYRDRH